jgi:Tol biopolymer transport system component
VFDRCFPDQGCVVSVVRIDGTGRHDLTSPSLDSQLPSWSPNSHQIVFTVNVPSGTSNIAMINANGRHYHQLTHITSTSTFDFTPTFSPDGRLIMFSHATPQGGLDLYTITPQGTDITRVTRTPNSSELAPQWAAIPHGP